MGSLYVELRTASKLPDAAELRIEIASNIARGEIGATKHFELGDDESLDKLKAFSESIKIERLKGTPIRFTFLSDGGDILASVDGVSKG